jgi:hypothetical protein
MIIRQLFLLIVMMMFVVVVSAQEKTQVLFKGRNARQQPIIEDRDTTGVDPFTSAARVELWHYRDRMKWWNKTFPDNRPLFQDGKVNLPVDSIQRLVVLDSALRKGFHEVLYLDQMCEEFLVAGCYSPRNLLVFYQADGGVIGCIEICVECAGGYVSNGLRPVIFCPERTSVLYNMINRRGFEPLRGHLI